MPIQLLINIFIAFLWMLLSDQWSILDFLIGFLIGIAIVFYMRRFFTSPFYLKKVLAIVKFVYVLIKEIISSSIFVIRLVINPKLSFTPGIFSLKTVLETDVEVTLVSMLITLTPGSCVMEISPDNKILYIHAMDLTDIQNTVIKSINEFEKAIMGVTRDV